MKSIFKNSDILREIFQAIMGIALFLWTLLGFLNIGELVFHRQYYYGSSFSVQILLAALWGFTTGRYLFPSHSG